MKQYIFDRFPTWLVGAYGGLADGSSPTPHFDRLASHGVVFDNVYVSNTLDNVAHNFEHPMMLAGVSKTPTADAVDENIRDWFSESAWADLRLDLTQEGYDLSADARLSDFVRDFDDEIATDVFSEDFVCDYDSAAEFATAVMRLGAASADRQLASKVSSDSDESIVVLAAAGGVPPTVADDPRLDGWRHVPMLVVGAGIQPGRCPDLMDVATAMAAVEHALNRRNEPTIALDDQWLRFDSDDAIAIRDHHGLYALEQTEDGRRERFFVKPDDRWNQLNVAAQQGDLLDRYRRKAESA